jgi:hypothetical protein
MKINRWIIVAAAVTACAGLPACGQANLSALSASEQPVAKVEPIAGTSFSKVTLSVDAEKRIGLRTDTVRNAAVKGVQRKVAPYAAVVYLAKGDTYAYSSPVPHEFVRVPLTIDFIDGDLAVLAEGPLAGTAVATVGVPELLGTEFKVGK